MQVAWAVSARVHVCARPHALQCMCVHVKPVSLPGARPQAPFAVSQPSLTFKGVFTAQWCPSSFHGLMGPRAPAHPTLLLPPARREDAGSLSASSRFPQGGRAEVPSVQECQALGGRGGTHCLLMLPMGLVDLQARVGAAPVGCVPDLWLRIWWGSGSHTHPRTLLVMSSDGLAAFGERVPKAGGDGAVGG